MARRSRVTEDIIESSSEASEASDDSGAEEQADEDGTQESVKKGKKNADKKEKVYMDPGTKVEVRNLYPGPKDKNGGWSWSVKYPTDLEEPVENRSSAQYALLVRNRKCYDGRKKLQIDSVVIQSQTIKDALGVALANYPGITTNLSRLEFSPPFQCFVHRWSKFEEVLNNETDSEKHAHIKLLHTVLEPELKEIIDEKNDLIKNGVMTFDMVYTLFEPGVLVYNRQDGHDRIFKLVDSAYGQNQCGRYFQLRCDYVDFDGENFGYQQTSLMIHDFRGTTPITRLSVLPLSYVPKKESVEATVLTRGHLFEKYAGYHFKAYDGIAIDPGMWGPIKYTVNSRVIIDTYAYNRFNPNRKINTKLTDEQRLLCMHTVRGYSLRDKKWLTFYLNAIHEIEWNESAFTSLVAPPEQKELILAFAQTQAKNKAQGFDDVIAGKGRGIIMLLSGPPGVGKTLTAESVAEAMKVPLYTMSAGDLGTDPQGVENALKTILEMSTKWDAVLLLDEADVFLEARSTHDLERNKLVSIFLRLLEYYEGILFLTTNRVDNIDAAFESRIHLSLDYPELDIDSRKTVWRNFLQRESSGISEKEITALAEPQLNGRQIKNILKTSQLLASKKGEALKVEHVQMVLRLRAANSRGVKRPAED
ncbi:putative AAA family ATPase [Rhizodiscina lignyota]|uniref:AAA family ATPase n=1 Tax=Rhizodiscina lignyota TaxID=1504668 RepID=A0A9P4M3N3_9PEZI|nr:putative AAA family ATPase [Rhizodiscina lignyota]